jgi:DNA-binding transcriptional regulator GbsR (MarR family)
MTDPVHELQHGTMETMGRITAFWGFSKIMGQLYGLLYLSPKPLTLDEMAETLSISKGNVSINIRALERWNMVRQVWVKGDRKDFYESETDFWKIIRGLRKKGEEVHKKAKSAETAFTVERLKKLEDFISTMDQLVGMMMTLEDLKRNFLGLGKKK